MGKQILKITQETYNKTVQSEEHPSKRRIISNEGATDCELQLWCFSKRDRDGIFSFDINRDDFSHKHVIEKVIEYTSREWGEIKQETHDRKGKSCHHLLESGKLSKAAKARIAFMQLDEYADTLFSMRLSNMLRVIGYREGPVFYAIWYDPKHEFCPSSR